MRQSIVLLHHAQDPEEQSNLVVEISSELSQDGFIDRLLLLFGGETEKNTDREDISNRLIGSGQQHERMRLNVSEEEFMEMFDVLKIFTGENRSDQLLILILEHIDLNVVLEIIDKEGHRIAQMPDEGILLTIL